MLLYQQPHGSEDDKIIVFLDGKCCAGRLEEFRRELEQQYNSLALQQNEEENEHDDNFIEDDNNDAAAADNYFIVEVVNHDHVYW